MKVMSNPNSFPSAAPNNPQFEASQEALSVQEQALATILDMATVEGHGDNMRCGAFYSAIHNSPAPWDLYTRFGADEVTDEDKAKRPEMYPGGADVVASARVDLDTRDEKDKSGLHVIDFIRTDDGLKAYEKEFTWTAEGRKAEYVGELSEAQVAALAADAAVVAETARRKGPTPPSAHYAEWHG